MTNNLYAAVAFIEYEGQVDVCRMMTGTEVEVDAFISDPTNGYPTKVTLEECENLMC